MAGHGDSAQQKANEFGKCLGLIWQLHEELQPFSNLIYQAPGKRVSHPAPPDNRFQRWAGAEFRKIGAEQSEAEYIIVENNPQVRHSI